MSFDSLGINALDNLKADLLCVRMEESVETVGLLCPNYFKLLTEGIWQQYEKQEGTDLTIRFNGCEIRVHRFLFSIFAPHMLDQIMESLLDFSDVDLDQEALESILEFLYKGQVIFFKDKLEVLRSGAGRMGLSLVVDAIDKFFRLNVDDKLSEELINVTREETEVEQTVISTDMEPSRVSSTEMVEVSELEWCEITVKSPLIDVEVAGNGDNVEEVVEETTETTAENHRENVICESHIGNVDLWDICLEKELKDIPPAEDCKAMEEEEQDVQLKKPTQEKLTQLVIIQPKQICFKCSYCSYKSFESTSYKKHLASKHRSNYVSKSKKRYPCEQCDFVGQQRLELSRHVQNTHSTDRPFSCEQCNYRARSMVDLKYHTKRHSGVKFSCETCGRLCSSYSGLCQHRKLHTVRDKPNVCQFCGYASSRKGDLNKHMENVHNYVESKNVPLVPVKNNKQARFVKTEYHCVHCDYKTTIRVRWRNHLAAQHQLDPQGNPVQARVQCDQCDFKCFLQYQLAGHKAKIHPTKLFECDECDHVTHLKANLDVHIKSKHRDERPFVCETCNFSTKTSSQLKSHLRSHSDEKFFCDLCNNGYSSKQHLKRHLIVMHDPNARRHACYLCPFVTKTKDALSQHIKRMHKNEAI